MQDREASEGVVATPRSGRSNMGTRGHEDTMRATYHFLFQDEGTWFSRFLIK